MGLLADVGIVSKFFDVDVHNECMKEYFYNVKKYDPRKTRMLYYNEEVNRFFELNECGQLSPVYNVHQILEPWKISLFKKQEERFFADRTNSFLVELDWLPF